MGFRVYWLGILFATATWGSLGSFHITVVDPARRKVICLEEGIGHQDGPPGWPSLHLLTTLRPLDSAAPAPSMPLPWCRPRLRLSRQHAPHRPQPPLLQALLVPAYRLAFHSQVPGHIRPACIYPTPRAGTSCLVTAGPLVRECPQRKERSPERVGGLAKASVPILQLDPVPPVQGLDMVLHGFGHCRPRNTQDRSETATGARTAESHNTRGDANSEEMQIPRNKLILKVEKRWAPGWFSWILEK